MAQTIRMTRSRYQRDREDIWMLQCREKRTRQFWSCTGSDWFTSRKGVLDFIKKELPPKSVNRETLEYRAKRYRPEDQN